MCLSLFFGEHLLNMNSLLIASESKFISVFFFIHLSQNCRRTILLQHLCTVYIVLPFFLHLDTSVSNPGFPKLET